LPEGFFMLRDAVQTVLLRELAALRRSIESYPDEGSLWRRPGHVPNAAGTLALHLAGNLQHYVGAVLGKTGYVRDRNAEFARRDVPRDALLAEIDAATAAVERGLAACGDEALERPYPERMGGHTVATSVYLIHLASHLAYHLGQVDYHRRTVTASGESVGAMAETVLPEYGKDGEVKAAG
jgi:uncharacterized damage-inducible protein DinB